MAEHSTTLRDYTKAITFYKEALVYNENDGKVCYPSKDQNHYDVGIIMLLCHVIAPIETKLYLRTKILHGSVLAVIFELLCSICVGGILILRQTI